MEMLRFFVYRTVVTVLHFTYQNWISKTVYCIRCVMVCKIGFTNWNAKIALLRTSMVVTYYIKLFGTGGDRHNGILMSLLLAIVAETKSCFITHIKWDVTISSSLRLLLKIWYRCQTRIENYYHHDEEQLGFYKKAHMKTQSKQQDVL